MDERRVVVTGMGIYSPVGNTPDEFWASIRSGKSGIDTIKSMDVTDYPCKIAGEVKGFEPTSGFKNPKDAKRSDRYTQMAVAAAKDALEHAAMDMNAVDKDRFGVIVSSGIGGINTMEKEHFVLVTKSPKRVSPFVIPMMITNIGSGQIAMEHGLMGPNMSIVTACATANNSIGEAWRIIKFGDADVFLAGGAEAGISTMGLAGFSNMRAMSNRNDEPQRASRPFDVDRDGFVMGEGASVVVIEELEHAKKRGANILAEIIGYGASADAHHITSPHPEGSGAIKCMEMALRHGGINPEEVDYINAHGTSTGLGDIAETKAIKEVFGEHATSHKLLVSSTKSMTGHLLGAAGGVELAASIFAINEGLVPPTINLENQDPQCDLDYVANTARECNIDIALSNSFGFGGHNASILVKRFS